MPEPGPFHFRYQRLVEFADTDLAGIVHFSNFFRYVESAEHAFFRSLGVRVHTANGSESQGWPRLEVSCRYLKPARFEQTLEVCLHIEEIRSSSLRYAFSIFALDAPEPSPVATGSFLIVHVEFDPKTHAMRKAPIPAGVRQKLERTIAAVAPRT